MAKLTEMKIAIAANPAIADSDIDDIFIIISCHPIKNIVEKQLKSKQLGYLTRTFDIMQHTLVEKSIDPFLLINRLASSVGGTLIDKETGRKYYSFKSIIIAPETPLDWGMLDFDGSRKGLDLGIKDATEQLKLFGI
jgi:Mor family transcriptional regulator